MSQFGSESVFFNTEDYPLGGDNEDFELPEESSREGFFYSDHGYTTVACL